MLKESLSVQYETLCRLLDWSANKMACGGGEVLTFTVYSDVYAALDKNNSLPHPVVLLSPCSFEAQVDDYLKSWISGYI